MLFKGRGRQTCRSDISARGADISQSISAIDRLTNAVFGSGLIALKCEQGRPRMVPRSLEKRQIKRLPINPKISRLPNYFDAQKK